MFDDVVVRVGRYGPYLERVRDGESQRANLPDDLPPDELTPELAEQLFSVPADGRTLGTDPVTGHEIVAKEGRYGPYVTELLPEGADDEEDEAAHGVAVQGHVDRDASRWRTRCACCRCRGWWAPTRRAARRSPRRTGATGRT